MVTDSYLKAFHGKRVLVTGHTGFKGSWLTLLLNMLGANVMGYALSPEYEGSHFERLGLSNSIRHVCADIRDRDRLLAEVAAFEPEVIFHLAAQALVSTSYIDPKSTFDINIGGGVNLLEAVRHCDTVRSLVFVTSDKCYENYEWVWGYRESDTLGGHDPYSASKGAMEIIFSSYFRSFFHDRVSFGASTARAGNVIGGGDFSSSRIVPDCIRALQAGEPIRIRNPLATRPWQHVLEPLAGYLNLASKLFLPGGSFNGSWNFGPPVGDIRTVLDVANSISAMFNKGRVVVDEVNDLPHEAGLLQLNSDKARQVLNWTTRLNFESTMANTAGWYKAVLLDGRAAGAVSREQIVRYFGRSL